MIRKSPDLQLSSEHAGIQSLYAHARSSVLCALLQQQQYTLATGIDKPDRTAIAYNSAMTNAMH